MSERHQVYLGLGANLGDRQASILQALQYIQGRATITRVSSFYETRPVGYLDQPNFLNLACEAETELSPQELLRFLKWIEKRMGRRESFRNAPRPIDIDILLYEGLILEEPDLQIPHPRLHERAFVLSPLAEIAPDLVHPTLNLSVGEMLDKLDVSEQAVMRVERSLKFRLDHDVQQSRPAVHVSLSRVGVTNLRRIIQLSDGRGASAPASPANNDEDKQNSLFYATLDLFADLKPEQAGVHMSRFSDTLEALVDEISLEPSPDIESLAERLAQQVVQTQLASRSQVHIQAHYPMMKITPVTGRKVQELYTLIGIAASGVSASGEMRTRRVVGVEVNGVTVCPCAQDMVRSYSKELLLEEGFSESDAERILGVLPLASHNQRGRGTLLIGSEQAVRAENLVHIVEAAMSSETYELLKREDEFFVVNKAHRNPRFVEDVVREMLCNVIQVYADLPDDAFVLAKQENLESIHQHNAFAERYGSLGQVRQEILGNGRVGVVQHTSLEEWLKR